MNWKLLGLAVVGGLIAKKALSNKDKKSYRESEDYCSEDMKSYRESERNCCEDKVDRSYKGRKEELYQVLIKGTVHSNGPKIVYNKFIVNKTQAQMFNGSRRNEAIKNWITANYPAAEPQANYRNFGVEVKKL